MTTPGGSDLPLLERLAGLPAVSLAELVALLEGVPDLLKEPLLAGLIGVDEQGSRPPIRYSGSFSSISRSGRMGRATRPCSRR